MSDRDGIVEPGATLHERYLRKTSEYFVRVQVGLTHQSNEHCHWPEVALDRIDAVAKEQLHFQCDQGDEERDVDGRYVGVGQTRDVPEPCHKPIVHVRASHRRLDSFDKVDQVHWL